MTDMRVVIVLDVRELANRLADARRREEVAALQGEAVDREALIDWAVRLAIIGGAVSEVMHE